MKYLIIVLLIISTSYTNIIFYVEKYSKVYKVDDRIILSMIKTESMGNGKIESHKNAIGCMQVTVTVAREYYREESIKYKSFAILPSKVIKLLLKNQRVNICIGIWYFSKMLKSANGNYVKAINYYIHGSTGGNKKVAWNYINNIINGVVNYE